MDGVTILTEYQQSLMSGGTCLYLCILAVIIFILSFIICHEDYGSGYGAVASLCVFLSVAMCVFCITSCLVDDHTEYKVAVDDTVKLDEFTNRYQIVSQDGKLFTVRDLEELE